MEFFYSFLESILDIINEMSPFLLLGFLIAGILHAFIPNGWYARYLAGQGMRPVINAALFGIPLPLCSCGVIPTAMSLRKEGASRGAVTSFLIATPQTGVDSILATSSLMGLPFAVVRPIAALVTALLGGALVNAFGEEGNHAADDDCDDDDHCHCCHGQGHGHDHGHASHDDHHGHGCHCHDQASRDVSELPLTFGQRCGEALRFGFVEMIEEIGRWLIVGLIVAGLITALVPDDWFAAFRGNTALSMLLVLCISIPMYVCATGSIPIAVALMLKGLTPGSALVLLMAGPAVNAASILVIRKVMGTRTLWLYILSIVLGALLFGICIDCLLPTAWFTSALTDIAVGHHDEASWLSWTSTILLLVLLVNAFMRGHKH